MSIKWSANARALSRCPGVERSHEHRLVDQASLQGEQAEEAFALWQSWGRSGGSRLRVGTFNVETRRIDDRTNVSIL